MSRQEWACEVCGLNGVVEYVARAGVFAVVNAIGDHHDRLAAKFAPHCKFDVHKVRVRDDSMMNEYQWNAFVSSINRGPRS